MNIKLIVAVVTSILLTLSINAFAKKDVQAELDKNCEEARDIKLKPQRTVIYNECINKFKKDKKTCEADAAAYNGNRIGGAPMFYELPPCVKAFDYRNEQKEK